MHQLQLNRLKRSLSVQRGTIIIFYATIIPTYKVRFYESVPNELL